MRAVVSGSASGIGRAIARRFLQEGLEVCGFDTQEGTIDHPRYRHVRRDIRQDCRLEDYAPEILVNAAGTIEENEAIDVNLRGTIAFTEDFLDSPALRSVLFIASASARNGAEFPFYVASKAGLVGYMKNLALKLAERGITCNSISPGGVITPMNRHILEDELRIHVAVMGIVANTVESWRPTDTVGKQTVVSKKIPDEYIISLDWLGPQ